MGLEQLPTLPGERDAFVAGYVEAGDRVPLGGGAEPEATGAQVGLHTGQTISLIMRNLLIAISNSATISSEGLIVQLLGVLIADVLIMDPHNAHLAISRFMPHASRRAPA